MHWLQVFGTLVIFFCHWCVGLNCDGTPPLYQKDAKLIATTQDIIKWSLDKARWTDAEWYVNRYLSPEYFTILAVVPDRTCTGTDSYWIGDFYGRNTDYKSVSRSDIGLWGDESKKAYYCIEKCTQSDYSVLSRNHLLYCETGVMAISGQVDGYVTNLADCYYGWQKDANGLWTQRNAPYIDITATNVPGETFCTCKSAPTRYLYKDNWHYQSTILKSTTQDNGLDLFTVFGKKIAFCARTPCSAGQRQICLSSNCDGTKENDEQCQMSCTNCNDDQFSDGGQLCMDRSTCPVDSSTVKDAVVIERITQGKSNSHNNLCRCDDSHYIKSSGNLYEDNSVFQAHLGSCQPCTDSCSVGYVARGCQKDVDNVCVCAPGYEENDDNECVECTEGKYKTDPDITTYDSSSLNKQSIKCDKCPDITQSEPGSTSRDQCKCPANFDLIDDENCESCKFIDADRPARPFDEAECRECSPGQVWQDTEENTENHYCESWKDANMIMQIECLPSKQPPKWRVSPSHDAFTLSSTAAKQTLNSLNPFWTLAYINTSPRNWTRGSIYKSCADCLDTKYRLACGGPSLINTDSTDLQRPDVYNIAVNISAEAQAVSLDINFETEFMYDIVCPNNDATPADDVAILRDGVCMDCEHCGLNQYVKGCSANNKGVCEQCSTCGISGDSLRIRKNYLYHPNERQCDNPATVDCQEQKCTPGRITQNKQGVDIYQVRVNCGLHEVTIWDPQTPKLENVDMKTKVYQGQDKFSRGDFLAYCPPGFYVNSDCFDDEKDWNAQCCLLCTTHDATAKRGPTYSECPGNLGYDTQQYVERCENGYFETLDDQNNIICTACQTCT